MPPRAYRRQEKQKPNVSHEMVSLSQTLVYVNIYLQIEADQRSEPIYKHNIFVNFFKGFGLKSC